MYLKNVSYSAMVEIKNKFMFWAILFGLTFIIRVIRKFKQTGQWKKGIRFGM